MHRICVYAGANKGSHPECVQAAQVVGKELVARGWGVVYGGAHTGLMGVLTDNVLSKGGEVMGEVVPLSWSQETWKLIASAVVAHT